jgi:hypothetical protein
MDYQSLSKILKINDSKQTQSVYRWMHLIIYTTLKLG